MTTSAVPALPTIWNGLRSPATLALFAVLFISAMGWLRPIELHLLDLRAALTKHTVDSDMVLIEIDEHSLQHLQSWPWPRRYHAQLLNALRDVGVKDIFYDVDFSSASTLEDDQRLATALASYPRGRIMLPAFIQPRSSLELNSILESTPLSILRRHSTLASVNVHPDNDGLVRRITASWHMDDNTVMLAGIRMAGLHDYRQSNVQIDYSISPKSIRRLSFADILMGNFDPGVLRNKHVIVGATAIELGDNLPVPVYRSLPGAVVQALAYQTLREGDFRYTSDTVNVMLAICLALFMGAVFRRANWLGSLLTLSFATIALFSMAVYAYREWHLVISCAPIIVQAVLGYCFFLVARIEQQHLRLFFQALDMRRKDALMSSVVNHSIDAIFTVSDRGQIKSANPAGLSLFNTSADNLIGVEIGKFVVNLTESDVMTDPLGDILAKAGGTTERQAKRPDGSSFPIELALSRMDIDGEVVYTVFIRDISERNKQREALEHQATHDSLTSLANRYLLNRKLHQALHATEINQNSIALLLLDLNKFKEINDTLGHGIGDQVLTQVAKRFSTCTNDSIVLARIGGDEFAVMLPESKEKQQGIHVAEALLESLAQPFMVKDIALDVGASIGIAYYPDHGRDAGTLLQNADTAMYAAKRGGTGISLYHPELTQKNILRMTISTGLRQAMADSKLEMYYQPKLDLATNRVMSVEALLRWNHPQLGFISPEVIVDVAENTGLIWSLTQWTLQSAINDARAWFDMGYQVRVAVNLSARLLQDMTLIERITACLEECNANPQWLTLEITESAIMNDPDRALKNAMTLSSRGIHLSIDDFGTGYSSLSYLRKLPADELKIDKSFVMDMLNESNDLLIVKSTIDLAHTLGLKVVAEGVESEAILKTLRNLGCDIAQGYLISRPIQLDKMTQWLERHSGETALIRASGY